MFGNVFATNRRVYPVHTGKASGTQGNTNNERLSATASRQYAPVAHRGGGRVRWGGALQPLLFGLGELQHGRAPIAFKLIERLFDQLLESFDRMERGGIGRNVAVDAGGRKQFALER